MWGEKKEQFNNFIEFYQGKNDKASIQGIQFRLRNENVIL